MWRHEQLPSHDVACRMQSQIYVTVLDLSMHDISAVAVWFELLKECFRQLQMSLLAVSSSWTERVSQRHMFVT